MVTFGSFFLGTGCVASQPHSYGYALFLALAIGKNYCAKLVTFLFLQPLSKSLGQQED